MKLNVRCCCLPTKVFGHVNLPDGQVDRKPGVVRVPIRPPVPWTPWTGERVPVIGIQVARIELKWIYGNFTKELAVYSDDRPREFWLTVVGFEEAPVPEGETVWEPITN